MPLFAARFHRVSVCVVAALIASSLPAAEPLPSWNDGPARDSIIGFVAGVTTENGPDFIPVPQRIAVFDNDGTLWCEQPMYFQLAFAIDRVKALAPEHPEWSNQEPFKSILAGDVRRWRAERNRLRRSSP